MYPLDPVPFLAKESTPSERAVILWVVIVLLVVLGVVCLWLGYNAPASKAQQAAQLRMYGLGILGLALVVWLVYRFVSWLIDR